MGHGRVRLFQNGRAKSVLWRGGLTRGIELSEYRFPLIIVGINYLISVGFA